MSIQVASKSYFFKSTLTSQNAGLAQASSKAYTHVKAILIKYFILHASKII